MPKPGQLVPAETSRPRRWTRSEMRLLIEMWTKKALSVSQCEENIRFMKHVSRKVASKFPSLRMLDWTHCRDQIGELRARYACEPAKHSRWEWFEDVGKALHNEAGTADAMLVSSNNENDCQPTLEVPPQPIEQPAEEPSMISTEDQQINQFVQAAMLKLPELAATPLAKEMTPQDVVPNPPESLQAAVPNLPESSKTAEHKLPEVAATPLVKQSLPQNAVPNPSDSLLFEDVGKALHNEASTADALLVSSDNESDCQPVLEVSLQPIEQRAEEQSMVSIENQQINQFVPNAPDLSQVAMLTLPELAATPLVEQSMPQNAVPNLTDSLLFIPELAATPLVTARPASSTGSLFRLSSMLQENPEPATPSQLVNNQSLIQIDVPSIGVVFNINLKVTPSIGAQLFSPSMVCQPSLGDFLAPGDVTTESADERSHTQSDPSVIFSSDEPSEDQVEQIIQSLYSTPDERTMPAADRQAIVEQTSTSAGNATTEMRTGAKRKSSSNYGPEPSEKLPRQETMTKQRFGQSPGARSLI